MTHGWCARQNRPISCFCDVLKAARFRYTRAGASQKPGFTIATRRSIRARRKRRAPILRNIAHYAPYVLSIVRIVVALLFFEHGTVADVRISRLGADGVLSLHWFAGAIEFAGGALLALGLFSRTAAFIMSGEMAFAYFLSHAPHGFFPILNRGDGAILYCFVFFYIVFAGAGPWSLDALLPQARLARSELAREALVAPAHHDAVVPGEHRPQQRRGHAHPRPRHIDDPVVAHLCARAVGRLASSGRARRVRLRRGPRSASSVRRRVTRMAKIKV